MNSKELFNAIIDFFNNDPMNEEKFINDYSENEFSSRLIFGVKENIIIIKENGDKSEVRERRIFDQALRRILTNNYMIFENREFYDLIILNGLKK